jgi:hypothetical protein
MESLEILLCVIGCFSLLIALLQLQTLKFELNIIPNTLFWPYLFGMGSLTLLQGMNIKEGLTHELLPSNGFVIGCYLFNMSCMVLCSILNRFLKESIEYIIFYTFIFIHCLINVIYLLLIQGK